MGAHNLHEPLSGQEANNPVLTAVAAGMLVNTSFHYVSVFNDIHQRYASSSFTYIHAYAMRTNITLFNFLFDLSIAEQVTLHMHVRIASVILISWIARDQSVIKHHFR